MSHVNFILPQVLLFSFSFLYITANSDHFLFKYKSDTPVLIQENAVDNLIMRLLPGSRGLFKVVIDPLISTTNKSTFELRSLADGRLQITGNTGVAAAWGLGYYLKQFCHCHFSWAGDQLNLPATLPTLSKALKVTANDRFIYYQNVCTVSYSSVWWQWDRWQREIDWMALNGINFPLAFAGQEAIWNKVFLKMGFTQAELNVFFGGPAFLAWARMGNIQGWGGPLPPTWMEQQLALQKQIVTRMREFGMLPVLPAFAGHVPEAYTRLFPNAKLTPSAPWGRFDNSSYCCVRMLDFQDPMFTKIGAAYLAEQEAEIGTSHFYNADTFNEMTPESSDPKYVQQAGSAVYQAMTVHDPQAVWVMQAWLFLDSYWQPPQVKALVTSVPQGRMLLLDLFSEAVPLYSKFESYYGQPFIWNMLHNFGGNLGLYGMINNVNKGPSEARAFANSTMVGVGLTPEGINQNYIMYDFMLEQAWRPGPVNLTEWTTDFAVRRYGSNNIHAIQAWNLLVPSVYAAPSWTWHLGHLVTHRPDFSFKPNSEIWYRPEDAFRAWDELLLASSELETSTFRYDLVDVTRQSLQLIAGDLYLQIMDAYSKRNLTALVKYGNIQLSLLDAMDDILATDVHFLLGNWTESAKALATTEAERILYEFNARNQITLWGPKGNIFDYASKQWSGIMKDYMKPRWVMFLSYLQRSVQDGKPFDKDGYNNEIFTTVERAFTMKKDLYPTTPNNSTVAVAKAIHQVFRPLTYSPYFQHVNVHFKEEIQQPISEIMSRLITEKYD